LGDVTLRLGERRLEITIAEAKEIQQRAVEPRLAAAKLHSALRGALRIYPGKVAVSYTHQTLPTTERV
jgi:hypothetical protein